MKAAPPSQRKKAPQINQRSSDIAVSEFRNVSTPWISSLESLPVEEVTHDFRSGMWTAPETCKVYSMTLSPGVYKMEVWGASGGSGYRYSYGGRNSGVLTLSSPTKIFAVAGSKGDAMSPFNGGCNGGGKGAACAGGGGASHISAIENDLDHRILVAGGSGGSCTESYPNAVGGGGGGEEAECGNIGLSHFNSNGKGANQTHPGDGCISGYGCIAGSFGLGGIQTGKYGPGGGGGWFGGATAGSDEVGAGGGSGFIFTGKTGTGCSKIDKHPLIDKIQPLTDTSSDTGVNSGIGKVQITKIIIPTKIFSKRHNPMSKTSLTFHSIVIFVLYNSD